MLARVPSCALKELPQALLTPGLPEVSQSRIPQRKHDAKIDLCVINEGEEIVSIIAAEEVAQNEVFLPVPRLDRSLLPWSFSSLAFPPQLAAAVPNDPRMRSFLWWSKNSHALVRASRSIFVEIDATIALKAGRRGDGT